MIQTPAPLNDGTSPKGCTGCSSTTRAMFSTKTLRSRGLYARMSVEEPCIGPFFLGVIEYVAPVNSYSVTLSTRMVSVRQSRVQSLVYIRREIPRKINRNGIANLPHAFGPRTREDVFVRKSLQSSALADSKVPHGTVAIREHVLSTRNPMIPSFERLRWFVQRATCMSNVGSRTGNTKVSKPRLIARSPLPRPRQVGNSVSDGSPRLHC